MKNCRKWRKLMFQSGERVLSARETKLLHEHLAGCRACSEAQDWDQAAALVLKGKSALETPAGFNSAVWTKIAKDNEIVPAPFRWRLLPATAGALCVAAAALGLVLITYHSIHIIPVTETVLQTMAEKSPGPEKPGISISALPDKKKKSQESIEPGKKAAVITESAPVLKHPRLEESDGRPGPKAPRWVWQGSPKKSGRLAGREYLQRRTKQPVITSESPTTRLAAGRAAPAKTLALTPIPAGIRLLKNKIHLNRGEQACWELALEQPGRVSMKIFSREGKLVKTILDNNLSSGHYTFEWNGTSESGKKVASGIYLLVINGAREVQRFRLAVIK